MALGVRLGFWFSPKDLERVSESSGWEVLAFVVMSNQLHLMVRTPRPNLAAGMQRFLSDYALHYGRRHRQPGHLFQGRYKSEMIEDESYYWTVSRYVHLNKVFGCHGPVPKAARAFSLRSARSPRCQVAGPV